MMNIQRQFFKFHNIIKIDFEGNKPLRDKRDLIINNLRKGLKRKFPENTPTFSEFNQGSYDLSTGVEPLSGEDYDIDVGIIFNILKSETEPVEIKKIVYDILNTVQNRTVEIKRPCVMVQYYKSGEIQYHVDLAIYAKNKDYWGNITDDLFIAKGYIGSSQENKFWEISEPSKLKELLKSKYSDQQDRDQFRRIIRYLKRWKDYNFLASGNERPTGIALTACCYDVFKVKKHRGLSIYSDLEALYHSVGGIINKFNRNDNIKVSLPVKPYNNLFEKMSDNQMTKFKNKLIELKNALNYASRENQTTKACMKLRSIFGGDFPTS